MEYRVFFLGGSLYCDIGDLGSVIFLWLSNATGFCIEVDVCSNSAVEYYYKTNMGNVNNEVVNFLSKFYG